MLVVAGQQMGKCDAWSILPWFVHIVPAAPPILEWLMHGQATRRIQRVPYCAKHSKRQHCYSNSVLCQNRTCRDANPHHSNSNYVPILSDTLKRCSEYDWSGVFVGARVKSRCVLLLRRGIV